VGLGMHLEALIERSLEMQLEAEIEKLRYALRGCDRASLEIHLQAEIM